MSDDRGHLRLVPPGPPGFEELLLAHADRLYSLARRWCRRAEDAEDLVQEAVLRAFRGFDRLTEPQRGGGWLYRILYNCFCDRADRFGREASNPLPDGLPERAPAAVDLRLDLRRAFESIPPEFSVVAWLAEVEGLSLAEIAAALGISPGTAASRLSRGRAKLRSLLAGHLGGQETRP